MRMIKMAITASVILFASASFADLKTLPCGKMVQTASLGNTKGTLTAKMNKKAAVKGVLSTEAEGQN